MLYAKNTKPKSKKTKETGFAVQTHEHHVDEVIDIETIEEGLIHHKGRVMAIARIEGTNFSVMSPGEQNSRESALIEIFSGLDYPIQFVTNTVVADTTNATNKILNDSKKVPEGNLKQYMMLYANALEQMRVNRLVLTQQSYLVISSDGYAEDPEKTVIERMRILESSLRERTGIVLSPITTSEDVYDAIQQIVLPEKIHKPSEIAKAGVSEPIHHNVKELTRFEAVSV